MTSHVGMPHLRRRGLTLAAAAALAGAPLLAGSAASAESVGTVTFSGGCGLLGSGLGGGSEPDTTQVSVPAGATMRFTNELGQSATLRLDGEAAASVPAGGSTEVVFHDGPVEAAMQVSCLLGEPTGTVTVDVSQADVRQPLQPSPPAGGDGSPGDDQRSDADAGSDSTGDPSGGARGPDSGRGSSGSTNPNRSTGSGTEAGQPAGEWWSGGAPPPAGTPDQPSGREAPAEEPRPSDELSARWGVIETDPPDSGGSAADPANVDPQAGGDELATEQVSQSAGTADDGPVGMLALIATVCVVGVGAGAVRTMIVQRPGRPEPA